MPAASSLKKQGFQDAYVRPVAWRGSESMGVSAQANRINVPIAIWQWPSYFDPAQKLKGIRLDMAEWRRPDPRTAPSKSKAAGLYMICTMSKHAAEAKGYADALMLDWRGQVAEATGANIFFVKDGKLFTRQSRIASSTASPAARSSVWPRIAAYEVIERVIMPEELEGFEQCFLTGTAAEVTPVSEIGQYRFEVGEIAKNVDERLFGGSSAQARDRC
jgi:branched-chain amino acid aminotransferase